MVKAVDFGLANENKEWELLESLENKRGTARYMAPQLYGIHGALPSVENYAKKDRNRISIAVLLTSLMCSH